MTVANPTGSPSNALPFTTTAGPTLTALVAQLRASRRARVHVDRDGLELREWRDRELEWQ